MKFLRFFISGGFACAILTLAVLAAALIDFPLLASLEAVPFDKLSRLRTPLEGEPVVVLAIDEPSLARLGPWPWPRTRLAEAVRRLDEAGARAIGLSLDLSHPEVNPGLQELRTLARDPAFGADLSARLKAVSRRIDGDRQLTAALKQAGNVWLSCRPLAVSQEPEGAATVPEAFTVARRPPRFRLRSELKALRNPWPAWRDLAVSVGDLQLPFGEIQASARGLGFISPPTPDPERAREVALWVRHRDRSLPSLSLAMAAGLSGRSLAELALPGTFPDLAFPGRTLVLDHAGRMVLDSGAFRKQVVEHSLAALLAGELDPALVRDRVVLIGVTAPSLAPSFSTPLGTNKSEVALEGLALAQLLAPASLHRPHWADGLESGVLLYFGLFLVLVIPRIRPALGALILLIFLATWYAAAAWLFLGPGLWLKVAPATVLAVGGFGLIILLRLLRDDRRRQEKVELNKMVGLSFQGQGMLDMALEKFQQCPVDDASVKDLLYNLALDFERKRMFNKATSVYRRILQGGRFRDVKERISRLEGMGQTVVLGSSGPSRQGPVKLGGGTNPTLGRYEILRELGQGAMGTVYLGRDPKINREVAIKTLSYEGVEPEQLETVKKRFFREAEAAGKLNHPYIVTIYDAGEDHDMAYLAMEFLAGRDLASFRRREGRPSLVEVCDILIAVAEALDYAHRHDVVHRDIKPGNIMVLDGGGVKVTDFGIARILSGSQTETQTGVVLGTPNYMSPEQVTGKKVDGRSDLFSLGAVAYELWTGERPFQGENIGALMYNIANAAYQPIDELAPDLPACCREVIARLLAKSPGRRPRDGAEVAARLRECRERLG